MLDPIARGSQIERWSRSADGLECSAYSECHVLGRFSSSMIDPDALLVNLAEDVVKTGKQDELSKL